MNKYSKLILFILVIWSAVWVVHLKMNVWGKEKTISYICVDELMYLSNSEGFYTIPFFKYDGNQMGCEEYKDYI